MKSIHIAAATLNQIPLDWEGNFSRAVDAIHAAKKAGVELLCLPELALTGYGCEDAFHSSEVVDVALALLVELKRETVGLVVSVGLPIRYLGGLYNAVAVLVDGEIAGIIAKQNLAGDGVHYEPRWFKPWPAGQVARFMVAGAEVLVGDLVFDVGGIRFGFEICEDAWSANRPGATLVEQGVDLILNPSASHFAFEKYEVRKRFVLEGSRAFGVAYVYSNLLGNEAGRMVYDGGCLIASEGVLVGEGARFGFKDVELLQAKVDVDALRMIRSKTVSAKPVSVDLDRVVAVEFNWNYAGTKSLRLDGPMVSLSKEEEFGRCLALALFDYMRKTFSQGYVLSLSGGADSSAVAVLVKLMFDYAVEDLGLTGFCERLGYLKLDGMSPVEIRRKLLVCVYQGTRNSSAVTLNAAKAVANGVGAAFLEWVVDGLVAGYSQMVGDSLGLDLNWKEHDIPLQNIQARARAPGIWMLANLKGGILVSTSNRSEAAVGYATMDGDTSGGLSPIAGIDKAFLLHWLVWCEGQDGFAFLNDVNVQQPTAELRPSESGQTDEADLMPYQILDAIERLAIRDKLMPKSVFNMMQMEYPDVSVKQMFEWVERFFTLWSRNQWKRERYAPSFHLDDTNLDPKSWCRFPIISGGFRVELSELKRSLFKV